MNHQSVRDLIGVMRAPSLFNGKLRPEIYTDQECAGELELRLPLLQELDRDPRILDEWIQAAPGAPRLGRYFEALLGFWIRSLMGAPRAESGVRIQRNRETAGELDFVFQFAPALIQHWEASVKFYLCTATHSDEARDPKYYIGTMTQDRLDLKMSKLLDQQLGLARAPDVIARLHSLGFSGAIESRAFVKGALFYPAASDWLNHEHPEVVSPAHARGWWSSRFPEGPESSRWATIEKPRWLSPFRAPAEVFTPLSRREVADLTERQVLESRRAIMVAELKEEDGHWVEQSRGLMIHPGWPWRIME